MSTTIEASKAAVTQRHLDADTIIGSVGPFTEELFEAVRPIWNAQLEHPFVKGVGDGTLEVERFENWVRQDYVYLREYSRMFARSEERRVGNECRYQVQQGERRLET